MQVILRSREKPVHPKPLLESHESGLAIKTRPILRDPFDQCQHSGIFPVMICARYVFVRVDACRAERTSRDLQAIIADSREIDYQSIAVDVDKNQSGRVAI